MKTVLSLFVVLLFVVIVVSCGGGSGGGDGVNMPDPTPTPLPTKNPQPPPVAPSTCALPPFTVDSTDNPASFTDGSVACVLASNGTLAITVCGDSLDNIGLIGNVVTGTRAAIDTVWADFNGNGRVDASEIVTSSLISGNLNLESNRTVMSVTNLRVNDEFWSVWFRGNCVEIGSSSVAYYKDTEVEGGDAMLEPEKIEDTLEWLEETVEGILGFLEF